MRLQKSVIAQIREARYLDGRTLAVTAELCGCSVHTVQRYAPGWPGKVSNYRLREAFLASGFSASEVARRMGWWSGRSGDASRVRRTLGLTSDCPGGRHYPRTYWRHMVDWDTAIQLGDVLGLAAWEIEGDER
jgi:hypothetical protein